MLGVAGDHPPCSRCCPALLARACNGGGSGRHDGVLCSPTTVRVQRPVDEAPRRELYDVT